MKIFARFRYVRADNQIRRNTDRPGVFFGKNFASIHAVGSVTVET